MGRQRTVGEGVEEPGGGGPVERVEVEDERVVAAGRGLPPIEQVGAGGGDEGDGPVGHGTDHVVDQAEQGAVGPVEVADLEDHRPARREGVQVDTERSADLFAHGRRVDARRRGLEAQEVEEPVADPADLAVGEGADRGVFEGAGDGSGDRVPGVLEAGPDVDAERAPEGIGHRPPHVGLAVGKAPTLGSDGPEPLDRPTRRLVGQPALAHADVRDQQHEQGPVVGERGLHGVLEDRELLVATDQGDVVAPLAGPRGDDRRPGLPGLDGLDPAPDRQVAARLVGDGPRGGRVGRGSDEDLARLGGGLQTGRGVHDVAHRGDGASGPHGPHQHLARVDADAQTQRVPQIGRLGPHHLVEAQRGPDGPLGVVLVGDGRPEQGDDGVAHDLVDPAAERRDLRGQPFEAPVDQVLDPLRVELLRQGGEPDQVGEEDGDDPTLVLGTTERVATRCAEPGVGAGRRAAGRAGHGASVRADEAPTAQVAQARPRTRSTRISMATRSSRSPGWRYRPA